jgi:hypothetical protein
MLPQRWMACGAEEDEAWGTWNPKLPDLTSCDFFLWGYVKDNVFVPSLLTDMLAWGELEY